MTEGTPETIKPRGNIEHVHRDVAFANSYRLELLKHTIAISGALLAFTVSFQPTLSSITCPTLMWFGWVGLGVAMIGGIGSMHGWDRYYISYRDYEYHGESGDAVRSKITQWRRVAFVLHLIGFAVGVLSIAAFAASNIGNVVKTVFN